MSSLLAVLLLVGHITECISYNILVVTPIPSKSHHHLAKGIVNSLLKGDHQVTWVTPYPEEAAKKNVRLIDVSATHSDMEEFNNFLEKRQVDLKSAMDFAKNATRTTMINEEFRRALVEQDYDAVITQYYFSNVPAGIAAVQRAPWILVSSTNMHVMLEYLVDEVRSLPIIPSMRFNFPIPMNFWQRLTGSAMFFLLQALLWFDGSEKEYQDYFQGVAAARGVALSPYSEAIHDISILFVNSHPSIAPAQSLPPNVIEIGGYHIDEDDAQLPKDLQHIMDTSTRGVIYFSMGSILKSKNLSDRIKKGLIKMFAELPYTVLWKFEDQLDGLPKNVHIRPWMPQAGILAHRNLKVFITHGGLLSTTEAVHYGVPLLALPVFGDQPNNAIRAVQAGYALKVDFSEDMLPELKEKLDELLNNASYANEARRLSKYYRARPLSPSIMLRKYVEIAIETGGAHHLRSKAQLYPWYQRWLLDQLLALLLFLYALYRLLRFSVGSIMRRIFGEKSAEREKMKIQ